MVIQLSKPFIDKTEIDAVLKVLKSGNLSLGQKLPEFEKKFAEYIGTKYAAAVNSGTAGLHACVKAIGTKEGDEIITSPYSFIASSNCALYEKAKPVFVDINKKSFNIDARKIEKAITDKTKAIIPIHIFGQPCGMDLIEKIAQKYNLRIIEDACEAIGAEYHGKKIGARNHLSVFSFYPNKQITTAEGGVVVTNNEKEYNFIKKLSNQGRPLNTSEMIHEIIGYNYRLNELSCVLGIEQLKKVDFILKKREKVALEYTKRLKNFKEITTPYADENKKSWFVYVIKLKKGLNREKIIQFLKKNGIQSRAYFPSIHLQPIYKKLFNYKQGDFPICEEVSSSTLALPFFTQMNSKEIDEVCRVLEEAIKQN
ncbi:MAG: DegT/DnrJ/EryC1/StrS family aminotransferase [Nanoarchaeota archaeon]|nr:DegT/DnrJ/EryC1/StrS family aminotransferase [Nanoarchaeota archaeon]